MFRSVFLKTLYDKRWFLVGWTIGSISLLGLTAAFYPFIADSVSDLLQSIPPALASIAGEAGAYATYEGYIGSAVFGVRAEMLFVPLAIILGLSLSVNEELSRKLYQLLAQPLSRTNIALQKWWAGVVVIALIMAFTYVSLIVITLAVGQTVPYDILTKIIIISALFTFMLFSLTFSLGIAFGRRGLAIIVPVVWVMASLLFDSFKTQIEWFKHIDWLLLHQYYNTAALVKDPVDVVGVVVLCGGAIIPLVGAFILFQRRDIRES